MGTEAIYPPQTILTRKDPQGDKDDKLVVTGAGSKIIVESLIEFGGPFELDIRAARSEYDHDIPEGVKLQQPSFHDFGPSPEQVFERQEREDRKAGVVPEKSARNVGGKKPVPKVIKDKIVVGPEPDEKEQEKLS